MVTLAVLDSDLADIDTFVESIELEHGVYCREHTDARRLCMQTSHPGAGQLPFFQPEGVYKRGHAKKRKRH